MTDTLPRRGTETPATTPRAAAPAASASTVDVGALPVVRLKHWFRWTLAAIIVFALAQFVWSLVTDENYEWDVFAHYFFAPPVLQGAGLTLLFTGLSAAIGFLLGTLIALARLSKSPLLSSAAWLYVWFFRSVPLVVQLVVWYNLGYLYPTLGLGTPFTTDFWLVEFPTMQLISALAAGVLGLSLHQAAYSAEIIRGGLLSVDQGQLEAAASLGIPPRRRLTRIVLPQAMRSIVPNATNEVIGLVKGTSVLFVIAIPELFYAVQVIYTSPRPAAEARRAGGFTSRGRRRRGSGRRRRGARGCATTGSRIRGRRGRRSRPARARVPSASTRCRRCSRARYRESGRRRRRGARRGSAPARADARRGRCTTRSGCSPPPECVLRPGLRRPSFRDSDPARARRSGCPRAARAASSIVATPSSEASVARSRTRPVGATRSPDSTGSPCPTQARMPPSSTRTSTPCRRSSHHARDAATPSLSS